MRRRLCFVCVAEASRLGYGTVRYATRVVEIRLVVGVVPAQALFRNAVCDVHPMPDDIIATGLAPSDVVVVEVS